jgi:hypothetical protein
MNKRHIAVTLVAGATLALLSAPVQAQIAQGERSLPVVSSSVTSKKTAELRALIAFYKAHPGVPHPFISLTSVSSG